ncbi:DUF4421 family protein [Joostella atrarenae]|uniref:DUF4421 family protein n=1 Tax=Joostella atrarenae TaxID=679257 RepID=A0ABS9IZW9_9FLAO|nr:DUF4421 family protein [Joostella atrarenae]MCF8713720.1 DUF4421 family protein [Joostella atrarenae]
MDKIKACCIIFFITLSCFAQEDSLTDDGYIKKFNSLVGLKLSFIDVSNSFNYYESGNKTTYDIIPNLKQRLSLGFQYRFIEFGLGVSPYFLPGNDADDNEDAEIYNMNFRFFYKGVIQTLSFYHQRGFTIESSAENYNAPYFETNKFQGSTAISLNDNFSYRATIGQREWQAKSAGSLIPKIAYDYTNFVMESSGFDHNANSFNISVVPAYQYSYVINDHMFLSTGASVGVGLNYNNFGGNSIVTSLFSISANGVFGFTLDRYFGGIHADLSKLRYSGKNHVELDDNITYVDFYIGYRFKPPKILTTTTDKINDKLKIEELND